MQSLENVPDGEYYLVAYTDDEIINEAGIGDKWEIAEERKEYVL